MDEQESIRPASPKLQRGEQAQDEQPQDGQQVEPVEEVIPHPSNKKWFVIGVAVVFVLVVVGAGAYFLTTKKDTSNLTVEQCKKYYYDELHDIGDNEKVDDECLELIGVPAIDGADFYSAGFDTSTWKTYRNEEYSIEIKYPSNTSIVENGPDSYELQLREGKSISGTQAPLLESVDFLNQDQQRILVMNIPNHKFLSVVSGDYDWWLRPCGQEGFAVIKSQTRTNLAGYKTLHVVAVNDKDLSKINYYCVNFPQNPIIFFYSTEFQNEADQILSTFKFIEPQSVIDTSDWKTYRNEEYGFVVKHPQDWKIKEGSTSTDTGISISFSPVAYDFSAAIIILKKPLSDVLETAKNNRKYVKDEIVKINNLEVIKVTFFNQPNELEFHSYLFEHSGYSFEFKDTGNETSMTMFDSFKFIEPQSTINTSDWKTYRNEKYGFELKYPEPFKSFIEVQTEMRLNDAGIKVSSFIIVPPTGSDTKVFFSKKPTAFLTGEPVYVSVEVLDNFISDSDFEEWLISNKKMPPDDNFRLISKGYEVFAGERAYRIRSGVGLDSFGSTIIFNHEDKTFLIYYSGEDEFDLLVPIVESFNLLFNN